MFKSFLPALLLIAVGSPALSAQQATYTAVAGAFTCADITPDGEIVVGTGTGGAYFWRWRVDPAPTYIGANGAVAVLCGVHPELNAASFDRVLALLKAPTTPSHRTKS